MAGKHAQSPTAASAAADPGASPASAPAEAAFALAAPDVAADLVFRGGNYFTAGLAAAVPADLAVRGVVIASIGGPGSADALIGANTVVVDASGGLLLPGFIDAHAHPVQAGVELLQCDLTSATDAASCLALIADYARTHPADGSAGTAGAEADAEPAWILGGGWSMEWFPGGTPTAAALDAIVGDRPVALSNRDHHGVWVSSAALQLAGITAATADPADGRVERDASGAPTGLLHEGAAALLAEVLPETDDDLVYQGLLAAQKQLHALGITGWQDAMLGGYIEPSNGLEAYRRALDVGTLRSRVTGALWWPRDAGPGHVDELRDTRSEIDGAVDSGWFAATAVKIMVDGVAENFTAALSLPYTDGHGHPTANSGIAFFDPEALSDIVVALDAAGFDVHFHALGDRAVTISLDAVAAARAANGPRDSRHQLAHLQIMRAADAPRFTELGATANLQALWAAHEPQLDELTLPFLDPSLVSRQYPFGDLVRAGAALAMGSDWPVSSPNPLEAIQVAVTRAPVDQPDAPPLGGPSQALTLADALAAYTAGSARVNRRETWSGRLEAGFVADLVLLDRDAFAHPASEIAAARVLGTWVGGERVYDGAAASAAAPTKVKAKAKSSTKGKANKPKKADSAEKEPGTSQKKSGKTEKAKKADSADATAKASKTPKAKKADKNRKTDTSGKRGESEKPAKPEESDEASPTT